MAPGEGVNLSGAEKRRVKRFVKAVERWKEMLQLDPAWTFQLEVFENGNRAGFLDLGASEYYEARLGIGRQFLDATDDPESSDAALSYIACHEMLHAMTADYHRAALNAAGENEAMRRELDYRYEQVLSKLTDVLTGLDALCGRE